jgi:PEP-CTERM motif
MKHAMLLGAAFLAVVATPVSAATIMKNTADFTIRPFGAPDTTSYGQVFTATAQRLTSFSFFTTDRTNNGARLVIAPWVNGRASGTALFDTLNHTATKAGNFFEHNYGNINLTLSAGQSYIAYLTVAGVPKPTGRVNVSASLTSPLGGFFTFLNSGTLDPLTIDAQWRRLTGINNLQYRAEFATAPVPEPATWAMMIAGFGLVGGAMRRRKAITVSYA